MASSKVREELTLPLDWDFIDACNGFTFDIGGSVMKLVYVSKDDWVEPKQRKQGSKGQVRLVNFSREELDEYCYDFIKTNVKINRTSQDQTVDIYTTGVGGYIFTERFLKKLNVRVNNLAEFDCFNHGFAHVIRNLPRKEIVHPQCKPAIERARKDHERMLVKIEKFKDIMSNWMIETKTNKDGLSVEDVTDWCPEEPLGAEKDLYPCGMAMLGSAFGLFVMNSDGTYGVAGGSHSGGRMFLGLGSLLSGAQSFEELMMLSERGDAIHVSITDKYIARQAAQESKDNNPENGSNSADKNGTSYPDNNNKEAISNTNCKDKKELSNTNDKDNKGISNSDDSGQKDLSNSDDKGQKDIYKMFLENEEEDDENVVFHFGQAVGKNISDFKREDLARCLLETMITDMVQMLYSAAKKKKLTRVFCCGGFVAHPLARQIITLEWLRRETENSMFDPDEMGTQLHFMVHGQSLGAFGAMLNHKTQWSQQQKS